MWMWIILFILLFIFILVTFKRLIKHGSTEYFYLIFKFYPDDPHTLTAQERVNLKLGILAAVCQCETQKSHLKLNEYNREFTEALRRFNEAVQAASMNNFDTKNWNEY